MDWRAELWLGHLDIVDAPDVLGGYADFLTIRLGEDSIADMLDSLSQDAENFAGLFDGKYVADSVQDQFREPFSTVLILMTVLVVEPLRSGNATTSKRCSHPGSSPTSSTSAPPLYPICQPNRSSTSKRP